MTFHIDGFARVALGLAIVLGLTLGAGGIYPDMRFLVLGTVAVAALAVVIRNRSGATECGRDDSGEGAVVLWPLFLPAMALAISNALAPVPSLGFDMIFQLAFFACVGSALSGHAESRAVLLSFVVGAVLLAASVYLELIRHVSVLGLSGRGLGAGGFLMGANAAAVMMAAAVPLVFILSERREIKGSIGVAVVLVLVGAIAGTGSRTGMIALLSGMVLPATRLARRERLIAGSIATAAILLCVLFYWPKFAAKLDLSHVTNQQRFSMIEAVAGAAFDSPLFGHGPWSFPVVGQRYLSFVKWELHPHNFFLRSVFEGGAIGLLAWIALLAGAVYAGMRRNMLASSSVLLVIIGGSFTDDIVWIPICGLSVFLFAGAALRLSFVALPKLLVTLLLLAASALAVFLPFAHMLGSDFVFRPTIRHLEEAIVSGAPPDYLGWQSDPAARFIEGRNRLDRSDTSGAIEMFQGAAILDPLMIFAPHRLALAQLFRQSGRIDEAEPHEEYLRENAPVLWGYVSGETAVIRGNWGFLDRHYRIEYPDPMTVRPEDLRDVPDPLDWKHHRNLAAMALAGAEVENGDMARAAESLRRASYLVDREYGTDPLLLVLMARAFPDRAEDYLVRARTRSRPAFPVFVYAPLIHRVAFSIGRDQLLGYEERVFKAEE